MKESKKTKQILNIITGTLKKLTKTLSKDTEQLDNIDEKLDTIFDSIEKSHTRRKDNLLKELANFNKTFITNPDIIKKVTPLLEQVNSLDQKFIDAITAVEKAQQSAQEQMSDFTLSTAPSYNEINSAIKTPRIALPSYQVINSSVTKAVVDQQVTALTSRNLAPPPISATTENIITLESSLLLERTKTSTSIPTPPLLSEDLFSSQQNDTTEQATSKISPFSPSLTMDGLLPAQQLNRDDLMAALKNSNPLAGLKKVESNIQQQQTKLPAKDARSMLLDDLNTDNPLARLKPKDDRIVSSPKSEQKIGDNHIVNSMVNNPLLNRFNPQSEIKDNMAARRAAMNPDGDDDWNDDTSDKKPSVAPKLSLSATDRKVTDDIRQSLHATIIPSSTEISKIPPPIRGQARGSVPSK